MRSRVPRLRDVGHRRARAARRPRRPQARPPPRAVRDERERASARRARYAKCAAHRRRGDGQLPPARRLGDLRHARAHGAGLLHALPARRRPGQLRLDRRRPRRGHALHRGAPRRAWRWRCCATSTWTRSTSCPTTTARKQEPRRPAGALPEPARQRLVRHRRRHGDEHPAAQPARGRSTRRSPSSTTRTITVEGLMRHVKGPDFPTGGIILGRAGHPRRLRDRPRPRARARARRTSRRSARARRRSIVTELPYQVKKGGDGGLITKIADLVHDKKIPEITDLRDESDRHGMRLVIELKRDALPKVVLNKLYKHTRDADDVRRQHGRARRRRAAHAVAARGHRAPTSQHQREVIVRRTKFELAEKERARAHPRGPADRARQPRRGHRADPRLARPRERARPS